MSGTTGSLTGTGRLLRLALRRDRLRIAIWVVATVGVVLASAGSVAGLYTTPADLARYARTVRGNAALIVQSGPGYGLDAPTVGAVLMNEVAIWTIILVALMAIFTTVRHTRAEEDAGRSELVRSAPVGRHAGAVAALLSVLITAVAIGAGITVGLVVFDFPAVGSAAFALATVGAAAVFAGVALVSAQIAPSSRGATGLALLALAVSFVLRAVGDVAGNVLTWLSPIGWAQAVRAFADERWWVLLGPIVGTAALAWLAAALTSRRDLGSGMLGQRPGRAAARRWLTGPVPLAVRLHRSSVIAWIVGVSVLGGFYGILAKEVEQILADDPELADFLASMGGGSITDMYLATTALMLGLLAGGYIVAAVERIRTEERGGRAEPLLAAPVRRTAWALSHLVVAVAAMLAILLAGGLAAGIGAASTLGEPGRILDMLGAALTMGSAAMVLGAIAFALCAAAPRAALLAWAGVAVAAFIGFLAALLDLPMWLRDLSPYQHVPALPGTAVEPLPLVMLTLLSAGLVAVGLWGIRHRDIAA